jgi:phosphoglycerol transferase MdoB-like AlkP superfamily enzyme
MTPDQALKNFKLIAASRYQVILLFTCISLAGFAFLRTLLLVLNWSDINHSLTTLFYIYGVGFVYDITFIIYFSIFFALVLLVLPRRFFKSRINSKILTPALVFLLLYGFYFTLVAEWLFWDEFHARFNFIAIDYLIYCHEVTQNICESYPLFTLLTAIFGIAAANFYFIRKPLKNFLATSEPLRQRAGFTLVLVIMAVFVYFFIGQPLKELSLNNYSNELAANGPYQFVAAFRNNNLDYHSFYALGDDRQLSPRLQEMTLQNNSRFLHKDKFYDLTRITENPAPEKRLNVFLITVESLSSSYLTRFGKIRDITPFIDEWFKQGLLFTNFYATGTRTTRGLEALSLSLPPTPGRSLVKRPEGPKLFSLGEVFAKRGYDVTFLYGGRGFFENMNSFFSNYGYRCVDQTDFAEDEITFSNAWGVCDGDLYNKAMREADRDFGQGRPFFFHLMTTSNHRPYTYPEGKIDIPSGHNRSGAVKYTDFAFKEFIARAKLKPWFRDTLFVIVADHCAHSAGKAGLPVAKYHIPLFIYAPFHIKPGENSKLASQIDVGPTLLGLLNFTYQSPFFGQDILRPDFQPRALIANYVKLGLLKDDRLLVLAPRQKITQQKKPYDKSLIIDTDNPLVRDCQAYYQGADKIISTAKFRPNQ